MKIRVRHSLLENLMDIPSFGDLMVTQRLKVGELKIFYVHLASLNSFLNQQILNQVKTSCIDLVITDQPNLVLDSGTRASLDSFCHHQITYCTVYFNISPRHLLKEEFGIITG